jgi:ribosome-binding protein aMBF1 (putative translation factor)
MRKLMMVDKQDSKELPSTTAEETSSGTITTTPETGGERTNQMIQMETLGEKVTEIIEEGCKGKTGLTAEDVNEMMKKAQPHIRKYYENI